MFVKNESYVHQVLCVAILVMAVYYPTIFAPFNSTDDLKMISSLLNSDALSFRRIFLPGDYAQYYRPLLQLTFFADNFAWGHEASFMHLENILLHLGNTLLIFWMTRRLLFSCPERESFAYAPFVTALIFGLHPIATEPVNWISGRTDLLAGFFVLISFALFLMVVTRGSATPVASCSSTNQANGLLGSYVTGIVSAIFLFAGCLSKETALFILPVILAWCLLPAKERENSFCRLTLISLPLRLRMFLFCLYSLTGSSYLALRHLALSGGDKIVITSAKLVQTTNNTKHVEIFEVVRIVLKTAGFYFKKLIIPVPLNFGINTINSHYFWLGLLVFCGVIWCICRRDTLSYLFLAAFMLTSSAFALPILKITWTPIAERYVYMASAPFVMGVTLLYVNYCARYLSTRSATLAIAAILGSAAVVSVQRNILWQDNFTLYEDTVKKSPDFGAIRNEYAVALRGRGRVEEADKIMLANTVDDFQPSSLNNILVLVNKGDLSEARLQLLERLKKKTDYDLLAYELLLKIDELRRVKTVGDSRQRAVDLEILADLKKLETLSGDPFYHYRTGKVQLRLGDKSSAKQSFAQAWQGAPQNSHYRDAARKLAERL